MRGLLRIPAVLMLLAIPSVALAERDCRGSNDTDCSSNDPLGTRRDLAGRPMRPDGITGPQAAAAETPGEAECKQGWTAASRWDADTFKKLCEGKK